MPRKHPHTYMVFRQGEESVVVVEFDSHPGWFQKIAVFGSFDRADDYADLENQMVHEWPDEADALTSRDDVNGGPPDDLSLPPASKLRHKFEQPGYTERGEGDHPHAAEHERATPSTDSSAEAGGGDSLGVPGAPPAEIRGLTPKEPSGTSREDSGTRGEQHASEEGAVGAQPEAPHDDAETLAVDPGGEGEGFSAEMPDEGGQPVAAAPERERITDEGIDDSACAAADTVECHPAAPDVQTDNPDTVDDIKSLPVKALTLTSPCEILEPSSIDDRPRADERGGVAAAFLQRVPKEYGTKPEATAAIYAAIEAMAAEGAKISYGTVRDRTGYPAPTIAGALQDLQKRGMVRVLHHGDDDIDHVDLAKRGGIRLVVDGASMHETAAAVHDEAAPVHTDAPETDLAPLVDVAARFDAAFRKKLRVNEEAVLDAYLAAYAAGETFSIDGLAQRCGVKRGSLPYVIDRLVEKGVLIRVKKGVLAHLAGTEVPRRTIHPRTPAGQPPRRFDDHAALRPEMVIGLAPDHPAVVEGRTRYPGSVVSAAESPRVLVNGINSRKIGSRVTKGPWKGMPIVTLTLEERATCPKSCANWRTCFGNGMQWARRHKPGLELENALAVELAELQNANPEGFVVRLHVLGDFYSPEYVACWDAWLEAYPALHVFGYTAWAPDSEIGALLRFMANERWDRFAIRCSAATAAPMGATTLYRMPEGPKVAEGIVCPAQTDATACCGTCGLCWAPAAKDQTIAFIAHGRIGAMPKDAVSSAEPVPFKAGPLPAPVPPRDLRTAIRHDGLFRKRGQPSKVPIQAESVEAFLARGGKIQRAEEGYARGVGGDFSDPVVSARPKRGF